MGQDPTPEDYVKKGSVSLSREESCVKAQVLGVEQIIEIWRYEALCE